MCQTPFLILGLQRTGQVPAPNAPTFQGTTQPIKVHKSVIQHNSGGVSCSQGNKTAWVGGEGLTGRGNSEDPSRKQCHWRGDLTPET